MTPDKWRRHNEWKYGPTKLVVSERPDMAQMPETAADTPTKDKDWATLLLAVGVVAVLTILALWGPEVLAAVTP